MTGKPGMAESYSPYIEGLILYSSSKGLIRKSYILECLMKLFKSMGAKVKGFHLMWWPSISENRKSQNIDRRPQIIMAGFMSRSRGLHWART